MSIPFIQKQFFALVQAGLWGTNADASLFDDQTDWLQLFQMARKQTLSGIVFDGMQTLPAEKHPDRKLYLQWCAVVSQIEENNRKLNRELTNVYALYRAHNIEPILLKGQGVAQNYRNPLHRQCGDIDLYVSDGYYDETNELLSPEVTSIDSETYSHINMKWHGVTVENHRVIINLSSPIANRHFQREIAKWYGKQEYKNINIEGCKTTIPPLNFDVAYILVHSVLHFLNTGIGLRQICDWACLLHAQRENIDQDKVEELFRKWGLTKAARIFGVIAVNYLGLPVEDLPVAYTLKDLEKGDWLLNDILKGGNFGKYNVEFRKRPKGYWKLRWYIFIGATKRCIELGSLAPGEAFWYPFKLIVRAPKIRWTKLFGIYKKDRTE